jgi:hypothetical protein
MMECDGFKETEACWAAEVAKVTDDIEETRRKKDEAEDKAVRAMRAAESL